MPAKKTCPVWQSGELLSPELSGTDFEHSEPYKWMLANHPTFSHTVPRIKIVQVPIFADEMAQSNKAILAQIPSFNEENTLAVSVFTYTV